MKRNLLAIGLLAAAGLGFGATAQSKINGSYSFRKSAPVACPPAF